MKDTILYGDCRDTLNNVINSSVQMCVTSPPYYGVTSPPYYGLRDYGGEDSQIGQEQTPEEYIKQLVDLFSVVRDKLKDDGVLWVNIGDSYYNYRSGKGQALPKQTVSKTNQDLPTKCNRRANKLKGYKEKDLMGIPWMLAFALRADGWYLRQDIIWHKPNPMPESVRDRCTKSHEYIFLLSKNRNYYFDVDAIKEPTRRKRSVWNVTKRPYKGAHFAVFPPDLIEPCILAGSDKGDIILDPFMGSGTTALVAKSLERHFIGCELHQQYDNLIKERLSNVTIKKPAQSTPNPLELLL